MSRLQTDVRSQKFDTTEKGVCMMGGVAEESAGASSSSEDQA